MKGFGDAGLLLLCRYHSYCAGVFGYCVGIIRCGVGVNVPGYCCGVERNCVAWRVTVEGSLITVARLQNR